ncbi:hypothetical protein [Halorussus lipolyticus]|uniref:hypothetical protein n=1 Tax=Halorussus lipolyticus TaxID=3034024 RepID=UPI0023E7B9F9|nr:hypothetical protein [Halorussus sp. DT80]
MVEHTDWKSWVAALVLGGIGLGIIAAPFVLELHALWVGFALTVGALFLAGAIGVVSPVIAGEFPPLRRGG